MLPYVVFAVVADTVMRVLVFVLNASMMRECDGGGNAGVGDGRGVVVVSAGHEYVGGERGSSIVSSAADVLGMSVVSGMSGVGGVCEMCMRLTRGGLGGEWIKGLGLGFTNSVETGGVLAVCLCLGSGIVGGVGGGWVLVFC